MTFILNFYWSVVALQCCIITQFINRHLIRIYVLQFLCKWHTPTYTHTHTHRHTHMYAHTKPLCDSCSLCFGGRSEFWSAAVFIMSLLGPWPSRPKVDMGSSWRESFWRPEKPHPDCPGNGTGPMGCPLLSSKSTWILFQILKK